jgi:hypothetical protein
VAVLCQGKEILQTIGIHQHNLVGLCYQPLGKQVLTETTSPIVRAAMIYQHATRDRDRAIAKGLGAFVRDAQRAADDQEQGRGWLADNGICRVCGCALPPSRAGLLHHVHADAKTSDDAGAAA